MDLGLGVAFVEEAGAVRLEDRGRGVLGSAELESTEPFQKAGSVGVVFPGYAQNSGIRPGKLLPVFSIQNYSNGFTGRISREQRAEDGLQHLHPIRFGFRRRCQWIGILSIRYA